MGTLTNSEDPDEMPHKASFHRCLHSLHMGQYQLLLYDWRESCLLIGPICLYKSLCLPENWSKLAQKVI